MLPMAFLLLVIIALCSPLSAGHLIRMEATVTQPRSDSCMDFQYYNPRDTYVASQMVNYGHYLSNSDFCRSDAYYDKVFITPIVICSICTFMLLCFFAGMFGRMFWDECKCRPPREDKIEFDKQKTLNSTLFYILAFLVLILDQLVFVGNERVNHAVRALDDSSGAVKDTTYQMYVQGLYLSSLTHNLSLALNKTIDTCQTNSSALYDLRSNITVYSAETVSYADAVLPVQDFLDSVEDNISKYGVLYRQLALYFIWALAIVFSGGLLLHKKLEFRYGMKQVMWFGICTYALYVALCLPWTYLTSAMADLCVEPSYNAVKSMPVEDSLRNTGAYFSTCTGNCTLTNSYHAARDRISDMNATVVSLLRSDCPHNAALFELRSAINTVELSLDTLGTTMACTPIQQQWFKFWNNGVCQQLYSGTFFIWGSQILTSLFLFLLIVCVSITYQFYGEPESPYPLASRNKVLPDGGLLDSAGSVGTKHSEVGGNDGFGEMDVLPSPAQQAPAISRVLSFHSDMSDELNAGFF